MSMQIFREEVTELGETYSGPAQVCTFHFSTGMEQFDWIQGFFRDMYIDAMKSEVENSGGKLLKLKIWRDTAPTWHTDYRCQATVDVSGEYAMNSTFPWGAVITASVYAVIAYFVLKPVIDSIVDIIYGPGGGDIPWTLILLLGFAVLMIWRPQRSKT